MISQELTTADKLILIARAGAWFELVERIAQNNAVVAKLDSRYSKEATIYSRKVKKLGRIWMLGDLIQYDIASKSRRLTFTCVTLTEAIANIADSQGDYQF